MLKNLLLTSAVVLTAASAQAATVVYSENFDTDPGLVIAGAGSGGNFSLIDFSTGGTPTNPLATSGVFFSNPFGGQDTSGGLLQVGNATANAARNDISGVYFDASGFAPGDYTVSFLVGGFSNPNEVDGDNASFSIFEGSGVASDTDVLTTELGRAFSAGSVPTSFAVAGGAVAPTQIGSTTSITMDGLVSIDITIGEAGDAGDYIGLFWASSSSANETVSTAVPSFTVDNIVVETQGGGGPDPNVPEPTSLALIGLGVAGVLVRRNRG